ncbi:enoyl-CoA hydratase/isomerase family protein [Parasphingorhabdus halotolerans]|uniref:Enoyl-CoA hydratase/isomerase family protein n=1 Tax=Parasphingorhabdus halotolerans TaxID=2725558 RepID=A0A6H2DKR0_9SPHN|nr:enoyl-CoA hydratase/isomerase family protein [Parasphingorhabdus halotolerans]QJB69262.1 enoyl-CoA hydratase/isomerase family protein [Parasphingorhabdus halotolerans]
MTYFPTEDRDGTIIITLTNGERNTLNPDLLEEGVTALQELAKNPPKGGIVLTGAGEHFTCGMDTKVAASLDEAGQKRARDGVNNLIAALHRLPCPLVCAVNGNSIGAGGIMMLCADWIYAATGHYKIGLPEAKAGLPFPPVPQAVLDHWLEPSWRRRLALSSMLLTPNEAIGAGLVEATVMPDDLIDKSVAKAKELAAQPGFRACKRQLRAKANAEIDGILDN